MVAMATAKTLAVAMAIAKTLAVAIFFKNFEACTNLFFWYRPYICRINIFSSRAIYNTQTYDISDKSLKIYPDYPPKTIQNSLENNQIKKVRPEKSEEVFCLT